MRELIPEFFRVNVQIPGALAFVFQNRASSRGSFGAGRTIDVELVGPELERLVDLGREVFLECQESHSRRPRRSRSPVSIWAIRRFSVQYRSSAGGGAGDLEPGAGDGMVSVLIDGAKASDYQLAGQEIDIRVMADDSLPAPHAPRSSSCRSLRRAVSRS